MTKGIINIIPPIYTLIHLMLINLHYTIIVLKHYIFTKNNNTPDDIQDILTLKKIYLTFIIKN